MSLRKGGVTQSELRTFQLVTNYRSHGGIVRCATAVIELITHFWPYAIDALKPEKGVVDGTKPVFFSGWDANTVRYVSASALTGCCRQCRISLLFYRSNSCLETRERVDFML